MMFAKHARRSLLRAAGFAALATVLPFGHGPAQSEEPVRISGPFAHDNLSIYLVHGRSADGPVPLTLQEALDKRSVEVRETGHVNELEIENRGDEPVFVQSGDIVKGGRQDRVVSVSLLLQPRSGRVPLAAFCVEAGRWAARGMENAHAFASANEMMPSREAKLAMRATPAPQPVPADGGAVTAGLNPAQRQHPAVGGGANYRLAGRPNAQGEVWQKVDDLQAALSSRLGAKVKSARSETSLQLALENEKLDAARKPFVDALQAAGDKEPDVIGYVFAVDGRINSADVYASNGLFRKMWPRLLKASITEALGSDKAAPRAAEPGVEAVRAFLAALSEAKPEERSLPAGMKIETRQSKAVLATDARDAKGQMVHASRVAF